VAHDAWKARGNAGVRDLWSKVPTTTASLLTPPGPAVGIEIEPMIPATDYHLVATDTFGAVVSSAFLARTGASGGQPVGWSGDRIDVHTRADGTGLVVVWRMRFLASGTAGFLATHLTQPPTPGVAFRVRAADELTIAVAATEADLAPWLALLPPAP
jgi:hypothetical protein